jgi:hypothetical protein
MAAISKSMDTVSKLLGAVAQGAAVVDRGLRLQAEAMQSLQVGH